MNVHHSVFSGKILFTISKVELTQWALCFTEWRCNRVIEECNSLKKVIEESENLNRRRYYCIIFNFIDFAFDVITFVFIFDTP
ncbi:MAG: hypothetical protein K0S32_25 [Bacteroidetes bacterium]|nr:hypothetical protein [Bacteroidota bacterium]